jgi:hypothetical protein
MEKQKGEREKQKIVPSHIATSLGGGAKLKMESQGKPAIPGNRLIILAAE